MRMSVIGGGTMGRGIAGCFAAAGFTVIVVDPSESTRGKFAEQLESDVVWAVNRQSITAVDAKTVCALVNVTDSIEEACENAQLIIEAAPEDMLLKRRLFEQIDSAALDTALLASNTSALSVAAIAASTKCPDRVLGMHFFNPPLRMPLVEIVRGINTSDESIARAIQFTQMIRKEPIVVRDSPGFATSRISAMVGNEAFFMLQEGVANAEDIDTALRLGMSWPIGPLALGDLVGLDVRLGVLENLYSRFGEKFRPCPLLAQYVDAGRLGRKVGKGVYSYDASGKRLPGSADVR